MSSRRRSSILLAPFAIVIPGLAGCGGSGTEPTPEPAAPDAVPAANDSATTTAAAGAPNIILLSIDTLRPDHLGCYGYERDTSPRIDRLRRRGRDSSSNAISSTSSWTLAFAHAVTVHGARRFSVHGCYRLRSSSSIDEPRRDPRRAARRARATPPPASISGPYLHPGLRPRPGLRERTPTVQFLSRSRRSRQVAERDGHRRQGARAR